MKRGKINKASRFTWALTSPWDEQKVVHFVATSVCLNREGVCVCVESKWGVCVQEGCLFFRLQACVLFLPGVQKSLACSSAGSCCRYTRLVSSTWGLNGVCKRVREARVGLESVSWNETRKRGKKQDSFGIQDRGVTIILQDPDRRHHAGFVTFKSLDSIDPTHQAAKTPLPPFKTPILLAGWHGANWLESSGTGSLLMNF